MMAITTSSSMSVKALLEVADMEPPCLRRILVRVKTIVAKIHAAKLPAEAFASLLLRFPDPMGRGSERLPEFRARRPPLMSVKWPRPWPLAWGLPEKRLVIRISVVLGSGAYFLGSIAYSFVRFSSCPYNGFQPLTSLPR